MDQMILGFALQGLLILGVLAPLVGFVILCFVGARLGKPRSAYVAVAAIVFSTICALAALVCWFLLAEPATAYNYVEIYPWASLGDIPIEIGVQLDSLTVIMFLMVTVVSTCIFVFSMGYMAGHSDEIDGQSKYHRFFTYLCLFDFSMLGLVISNSILFLFIFWELVGLCSYLLIGFYFHKSSASNAAMKAFITNRVGDFGFLIGLMMVVYYLGDLSLNGSADLFNFYAKTGDHPLFTESFLGVTLATWMGICLFCGAIGKSAQFPLHVWLPDAMEGPTPVSALIHAATMVAAGVYLVARIFRLLTPDAQLFIAIVGAITLSMAALIAIVQTDIKKVLAYSTVSQLGYMIFGMGVGAWVGALFHLLTHAFFKALLFLGSGQVIEGCHHEQEITKMGGLRKKMPVTCWTFFLAVLAISGVGLPLLNTIPLTGLGGYYSKDEILAVAYYRGHPGEHHDTHDEHGANDGHAATNGDQPTHAGALAAASHGPVEAHRAETATDATPEHAAAVADGGHRDADAHGGDAQAGADRSGIYRFLFWIATVIAYVTPFYMMRVWWLTFMGEPRDEHVYEHAHESKLMYWPLVVLAVGTCFVSWFLFRGMVAAAAPTFGLVSPISGHSEAVHHAAHWALFVRVWPSFIVGFGAAWLIYRNGLELPTRIASAFRPIHTLLWNKFYFDELYGSSIVKQASWASVTGAVAIGRYLSRWFDTYIVDGLVNFSARVARLAAMIAGRIMDSAGLAGRLNEYAGFGAKLTLWLLAVVLLGVTVWGLLVGNATVAMWAALAAMVALGVDGVVEALAQGAWDIGGAIRTSQTGRIRGYLLFAVGGVAVAVVAILSIRAAAGA